MKIDSHSSPQIVTIHGFRVLPISPITKAFERALKLLASLWFADLLCLIIKTKRGWKFGDPPADGRYVHSSNPYREAIFSTMWALGIEPPPMPFILAPGPTTLQHEWGHHVDFCWAGNDEAMLFSTRWFSQFYAIPDASTFASASHGPSDPKIVAAVVLANEWHAVMVELFANLFDDWMRGYVTVDHCEPAQLNRRMDAQILKIDFLPDVTTAIVREKTYAQFGTGLKGPASIPEIRPDLLGRYTDHAFARLRIERDNVRAEMLR